MNSKHTTAVTTTTSLAVIGSHDTEDGETPLHSQQTPHFSPFPIGKNHHHHHHHLEPLAFAYKECLKNHAAIIGSHALDGCGEFLPSLTCTPHEPSSLKCAVCGCHRNFHRRELVDHDHMHAHAPHALLSLRTLATVKNESLHSRKRFRTKFSETQKEKMSVFAEKVGWKMQRCDDEKVTDFCNEIGIKRGVFKVWMHNNKHTFGKKDKEITASPTTAAATEGFGNKRNDVYNVNVDGHDGDHNISKSGYQENGGGGGGGCVNNLHASKNGLSS